MKEIKIPYEKDGHRRDVCFTDVQGYRKSVLASTLGFSVTYAQGAKCYIFSCDNKEFISCECIDSDKYDEKSGEYFQYDISDKEIEKFVFYSNY